jgi:hypothetical protein
MPLLPLKCYELSKMPQLLPLFSPWDLHLNLFKSLQCINSSLFLNLQEPKQVISKG